MTNQCSLFYSLEMSSTLAFALDYKKKKQLPKYVFIIIYLYKMNYTQFEMAFEGGGNI